MNPILKNIIAVVAAIIVGSIVNMSLITASSSIIPPPEGYDLKTVEGLKAAMPFMEPKHFLMPFLAHALGTLVGAGITAAIASKYKMRFAVGISIWFLISGIINVIILPSPLWFTLVDLIGAYLPMGYIAGKIISNKTVNK